MDEARFRVGTFLGNQMSVVAIYGFRGTFAGNQEYDYTHPEVGAVHRCLLFLAQTDAVPVEDLARAECGKYGFPEPEFSSFGLLKVEVLNTDQYRGFAGFYEEALKNGNSLVYYP